MDDEVDPLKQALETLNFRELTGDSNIDASEAAFFIREGIYNRNMWNREYEIWQSVLDGAATLANAHGWKYGTEDGDEYNIPGRVAELEGQSAVTSLPTGRFTITFVPTSATRCSPSCASTTTRPTSRRRRRARRLSRPRSS